MKRLACLMVTVGVVIGVFAGPATALTPETTSVQTIVNTEYWDSVNLWKPILNYWGYTYWNPGVKYYDYYNSYGQLVDFSTPCNSTAGYHGSQGFYCTTNQTIYIDYNQQRDNIRTYGDGAVALWLDHEFGHHVQYLSRFSANAPYVELNADCIAGITFRSEITRTGNLNSGDYTEARNNIYRAGGDGAHGTGTQRLNAFDYGYNDFGWPDCNRYW